MSYIVLSILSIFLVACPLAMGQDALLSSSCVVDQCDDGICSIETPEGWVAIVQTADLEEGKKIDCPLSAIDPT